MADADPFAGDEQASSTTGAERRGETGPAGLRRWRTPLMLLVPLLIAAGGLYWWLSGGDTVETDNAYVKQDIVSVSSEVAGRIISVQAKENAQVKAGDILFTIEDSPFRVAVAQADAQIAGAQAHLVALQADVGATAAKIAAAGEDLELARKTYVREKELMDRGFNTRARMDAAEHAVAAARDRVAAFRADVTKAQAQLASGRQLPGVNPEVAGAEAQRARAMLDLSRTVIRAPVAGRVSQAARLQVGGQAVPGVPMLSLVREDRTRIEANFKETDLDRIRPGEPADIEIDAYPGVTLHGRVESIGAGTGSEFSILPAQNATGNWVKIVQRVPVRIAVTERSPRPLLAGLSAEVKVHVGSGD
ncbi:MAG: HlyD family secretion protein [Novosphingobium sp.]